MNEKSLLLAEAMNYIADEYLEQAHPEIADQPPVKRRPRVGYRIALVACLALVAVGALRFALGDSFMDLNLSKGEAAAPEQDCVADGMSPSENNASNVGSSGNSGTRPIETTAETSTADSTDSEALPSEAETSALSEIP